MVPKEKIASNLSKAEELTRIIIKEDLPSFWLKFYLFTVRMSGVDFSLMVNDFGMEDEVAMSFIKNTNNENIYVFEEQNNKLKIDFFGVEKIIYNIPRKLWKKKLITIKEKRKTEAKKLFNFWKEVMNSKRSVLNETREKLIIKGLSKFGYDYCKDSIIGCSKSLWHMGFDNLGNNRKKKYNSIELIFKNPSKLEFFNKMKDLDTIEKQIETIKNDKNIYDRNEVKKQSENWLEEKINNL